MKPLELYLLIVFHLATPPAVAYPIMWALRGKWRSNRVGRALMYKSASLGAIFVVALVMFYLPSWHWLVYVYAAMFTLMTLTLYRQLWVLVQVQREQRREGKP